MEAIFAFTSYNQETLYGYGTEREASLYLNLLNKDREINLYEMEIADFTEEQADTLAISLFDALYGQN